MVDPQPLTVGRTTAQAVGATSFYDLLGPNLSPIIWCEGDSSLVVQVQMTANTPAVGDLTVAVQPYIDASAAVVNADALEPVTTPGPTLSGSVAFYSAQFDVTAYDAVRVRVNNTTASPATITRATWRLA
jgi:hypothetical protein